MTRSTHIQIRVSEEEKARIEKAAAQAGLKVSDYLRRRALPEPPPAPTRRWLPCPIPGCNFTALSPAARCPYHGRTVA